MLSFTLQPMILFVFLGVLIGIFDNIVMGSATFSPATVKLDDATITDNKGRISPKTISCNSAANNDSVYCIFRVADIKTYNGLEALGIGLPMLTSVNSAKLNTLIKAALIMFIFSKFMDNVSDIAKTLTGGTKISTSWASNFSPSALNKTAYDKLSGIQSRGMRAISGAARSGFSSAAKAISNSGNQGKSVSSSNPSASDNVGGRAPTNASSHVGSANHSGASSHSGSTNPSGASTHTTGGKKP